MTTPPHHQEFDARHPDGRALAEVKFSVDALRTVRVGLMNLAYALEEHPQAQAYLVLVDPHVTDARLLDEWRRAQGVLRPEMLARLAIALIGPGAAGDVRGIPAAPPADVQHWLRDVALEQMGRAPSHVARPDYGFIITKLLIHRWLTEGTPVTTAWLMQTAGCSYPTAARAIQHLGSLIERQSDRRIAFRFFPQSEFAHLVANSERARSTTRFVDTSGQPRSPESHLRRLEKLKPAGIAIGGVMGAKHYLPELNLVGTPRLDLSVHCHDVPFDLDVIKSLDPALKLEEDRLKPANVVVHAVRHADPLFTPREGGLAWADPVECLLDLHEGRFELQAEQFLAALTRSRTKATP